jgi:hypothetical protein
MASNTPEDQRQFEWMVATRPVMLVWSSAPVIVFEGSTLRFFINCVSSSAE